MRELAVLSGKGGTGKTSLVASFAALARPVVLADADVDAPDLHLILDPEIESREPFSGGVKARILAGSCMACGRCEELCRFDAIAHDGPGNERVSRTYRVRPLACEGCGVCAWFCPESAVILERVRSGECFVSGTRFGPMAHAELAAGEETSGRLVSRVRAWAGELAKNHGIDRILIDGPPGVGCPAIASITGADLVLVVTEPTLSGLHDMDRVLDLADHFRIPSMVVVNRYDLHTGLTEKIESRCRERGVVRAGRIRYSRNVVQAMAAGKAVVEAASGAVAEDIRSVWKTVEARWSTTEARDVLLSRP